MVLNKGVPMHSSRRPFRAFLAGTITGLLPAILLAGSYLSYPLDDAVTDRRNPVVTAAPAGAVLAWEQDDGIWTGHEERGATPYSSRWFHGPGMRPEVGRLADGTVVLAWLRGTSQLVIREGDGDLSWQPELVVDTGLIWNETSRIDLWTAGDDVAPPVAWLTVAGTAETHTILFLSRDTGGWSAPQYPVTDQLQPPHPQVTCHLGPVGQPLPTIFFVQAGTGLFRVDLTATGTWTPPVPQTGPGWDEFMVGQEFDVVADGTGGYALLALGLQPACPCNSIFFATGDAAGLWTTPLDMTADIDAYNWPFSPRLASDLSGGLHAFWYQLGSDSAMTPHSTRLFHRRRDPGSGAWADITGGLPEPYDKGIRQPVDLAPDRGGHVFTVWAKRDTIDMVPHPHEVWLRYWEPLTGAPDRTPRPVALRVDARPNPFNPSVTILVEADREPTGLVLLDARGRRVATPALRRAGDCRWLARWDGRDAAGHAMPSGTYLVRVSAPGGTEVTAKVMLVR